MNNHQQYAIEQARPENKSSIFVSTKDTKVHKQQRMLGGSPAPRDEKVSTPTSQHTHNFHLPPSPMVTPPTNAVSPATRSAVENHQRLDQSTTTSGETSPTHNFRQATTTTLPNSPFSDQHTLNSEPHSNGNSNNNNNDGNKPGSASKRNNSNSNLAKKTVPHVYHDYSQLPQEYEYVRKKTGGVTQPFPEKLYEMLEAESENAASHEIVSWMPHGRAFVVRRPKEFTAQIMPKYFRQTKLTSFQRQLNLYGFRRITQGIDAGSYYHSMFLRGRPALCQRMVRQKVKGTGHKQPADASSEPNFYSMPAIQPESTTVGVTFEATIPATTTTRNLNVPSNTRMPISSDSTIPSHALPTEPYNNTRHDNTVVTQNSSIASSLDPMSPAFHAAHLLQGIATGCKPTQLPPAPFISAVASLSAPSVMQHEYTSDPQHHASLANQRDRAAHYERRSKSPAATNPQYNEV